MSRAKRRRLRADNVKLGLTATLAVAVGAVLMGCGDKDPPPQAIHCVDQNNVVVEEWRCDVDRYNPVIYPGYGWYYGGSGYYNPGYNMSGTGGGRAPNPTTSYKSQTNTYTAPKGSTSSTAPSQNTKGIAGQTSNSKPSGSVSNSGGSKGGGSGISGSSGSKGGGASGGG